MPQGRMAKCTVKAWPRDMFSNYFQVMRKNPTPRLDTTYLPPPQCGTGMRQGGHAAPGPQQSKRDGSMFTVAALNCLSSFMFNYLKRAIPCSFSYYLSSFFKWDNFTPVKIKTELCFIINTSTSPCRVLAVFVFPIQVFKN